MSELTFAEVEAWLEARRDLYAPHSFGDDAVAGGWRALDNALDDLRAHMNTGTPLGAPVQPKEKK